MTGARLVPRERRAFRLFSDAVLAFSTDPGPENLERYLVASRTLEESRRSWRAPAQARPRAGGSCAAERCSEQPRLYDEQFAALGEGA